MKKLIALGALLVLTGCGDTQPVDPCQVNPTRTNALGQCVEADGEPCDSDPCDSDDLEEDSTKHKSPQFAPQKKPVKKR